MGATWASTGRDCYNGPRPDLANADPAPVYGPKSAELDELLHGDGRSSLTSPESLRKDQQEKFGVFLPGQMYPSPDQIAAVREKVQARHDGDVVDYTDGHSVTMPSIYAEQERPPVRRSETSAQLGKRDPTENATYPGSKHTLQSWDMREADDDVDGIVARFTRKKRKAKHSGEPFDLPINAVAEALDRPVRSIRDYIKSDWLPEASVRSAGNHRRYSARQIAGLAKIASKIGLDTSHHITSFMVTQLTELSHQLWTDLSETEYDPDEYDS